MSLLFHSVGHSTPWLSLQRLPFKCLYRPHNKALSSVFNGCGRAFAEGQALHAPAGIERTRVRKSSEPDRLQAKTPYFRLL